MNRRLGKLLKWTGRALAILLVLLSVFAYWLIATESGAHFALERAKSALDGKFTVGQVSGALHGPLQLRDVVYRDAAAGLEVRIKAITVDHEFWGLLRESAHVRNLQIEGVTIALTTLPPAPPQAAQPTLQQMLTPPFDILLDRVHVGAILITRDGKPWFAATGLDAAAAWTGRALVVKQLALRAADGNIDLSGAITQYRGMVGKGRVDVDWKIPGDGASPALRAAAHVDFASDGRQVQFKLVARQPLIANATGSLNYTGTNLPWTIDLGVPSFDAGRFTQHDTPKTLALKLSGRGDRQAGTLTGTIDVDGHRVMLDALDFASDRAHNRLVLNRLALRQARGGLEATGEVVFGPHIGWNLQATGTQLDPGEFVHDWPGAIDFQLSTSGTMENDGPVATLRLAQLGGQLRQRPLEGSGELAFSPPLHLLGKLKLVSGKSAIVVSGKGGAGKDAPADVAIDLDIDSLGDWVPNAGGAVRGNIVLTGAYPNLDARGQVQGKQIVSGATHLDAVTVDFDLRNLLAPSGSASVNATRLAAGGYVFDTLKLDAHGNAAAHQLVLAAHGKSLALDLALDGALHANKGASDWRGMLKTLTLRQQGLPEWALVRPTALAYAGNALSLNPLCLRAGRSGVCVQATQNPQTGTRAKFSIEHVPLAMLAKFASPATNLQLAGELDGDGVLEMAPNGALSGQATIASGSGSIAHAETATQALLSYENLRLDAALSAQHSTITIAGELNGGGRIDGHINLGALQDGAMPLSGNLSANVNDLSFVDLLSSQVSGTRGRIAANFALSGTTIKPEIDGSLDLHDFATEVPAAGIKLHDGHVTVASRDGENLDIDGAISSGGGKLAIKGGAGLAADAPVHIGIIGENFLAASIPGAKVYISPGLRIERDAQRLRIGGELRIPRMAVDLNKLPGGAKAATLSPDVVVTDQPVSPPTSVFPLEADITLKLGTGTALALDLRQGEQVHLIGYGLDSNLGGQLRIVQMPGKPPIGRGQIEVNGTFKAYGQDLKIERGQGRLLFAGTPVEDPGLDISATRSFPEQRVVVGLRVRGTARIPQLTVFSRPPMEQADALSYLVAGKPLSQLRGGDGNAVSSAASALGTAGSDLLAKSIGARLGLDDVGVADSSSVGGAALTIGKYLSPRLYIGYGVGLFNPGQVVTLRYMLSRLFSFEMQNGTVSSRASINYRIEK